MTTGRESVAWAPVTVSDANRAVYMPMEWNPYPLAYEEGRICCEVLTVAEALRLTA